MTNEEFDKIIDLLNNIKAYDVDSGPKGEEKRIALDFAIQLVDHEKCIVNALKKYYQSVGIPDKMVEDLVKLRNDSGADEISKRLIDIETNTAKRILETGEHLPVFWDEYTEMKMLRSENEDV